MARNRSKFPPLQKALDREEAAALAVGGASVGADFVPDESVLVKRVILSLATETITMIEWTLAIHRQGGVVAADRDVQEAVVKTGLYAGRESMYVDFKTSIRMNRADQMSLIVENKAGATADVHTSLLVLFRE